MVVIDTNVLVAALRSSSGSSHEVVRRAFNGDFKLALSVPLYLEYVSVLTRPGLVPVSSHDAMSFCQNFAFISSHHKIHFLWRPLLADPKDDMVLELAVASGSEHIVTHNVGDFRASLAFNVQAIKPADFLLSL